MHLLDVNVLIARSDDSHPSHGLAKAWMAANHSGWATCPLTENGLLRILGNPAYPGNGAGSPDGAAVALRGMISAIAGHRFLPDDLSLHTTFPSLAGIASAELTDVYLLALAVKHGAKFLTLDRRIDPTVVIGGPRPSRFLPDARFHRWWGDEILNFLSHFSPAPARIHCNTNPIARASGVWFPIGGIWPGPVLETRLTESPLTLIRGPL